MAFTGIERQQVWPPSDPTEYNAGWTQPASPWPYEKDGPNPALTPSNSSSAQHLRSRKRDAAGFSTVPPYHPDYDESAQHEHGDHEGEGESRREEEVGAEVEMKVERVDQDGCDDDDKEPLAVRVEKCRSGEAIG